MSMLSEQQPRVRFLSAEQLTKVLADAQRILEEVGVEVELEDARQRLHDAGARIAGDARVNMDAALVQDALASVPHEIALFDRDGDAAFVLGEGVPRFCPGSAAIRVLDPGQTEMRPSTLRDCERFARLTEALPAYELQSTCVVPTELPVELGDRHRLAAALTHCRKPILTGTFDRASFAPMHAMLACVRGGEQELRDKPLAIFDCCPTAPLSWSVLTCSALIGCAESGVPAELISVPMTGATAPMSLSGAVAQHTAESLSGVVIHQLTAPGAPIIWGSCASGFDMRHGTSPMGATESMMMNAACAQVGRHLGMPTHGFFGLSDAKVLDYQAGYESGAGALLGALAGVDVVTGAGILEFVGCQSLDKLVLDHETCRSAKRALEGIDPRAEDDVVELVRQGVEAGQFLNLRHTRDNFRQELLFPGRTVDRQEGATWAMAGGSAAHETARTEVDRLLGSEGAPPLAPEVARALERLQGGANRDAQGSSP